MSLTYFQLAPADQKLLKRRLSILEHHTRLAELKHYIQHGNTSCYMHCLAVAYVSLFLARRLHLTCCLASLLTAALLHDYFLYDWHDKNRSFRWHGFRHPGIALKNASSDWHLNQIESDAIRCHMFPLTPKPPIHPEGILICIADKFCSLYEIFRKDAYGRLSLELMLREETAHQK